MGCLLIVRWIYECHAKFTMRFNQRDHEFKTRLFLRAFFSGCGAHVTVSVVALPLAMAFAIASGLTPEAGLFTAIIGGFLVSLFSGSRVQVGGPAGAFIVIVYGIVQQHGVSGLLLATLMSVRSCSGSWAFCAWAAWLSLFRCPLSWVYQWYCRAHWLSQLKDLGCPLEDMPADFFPMMSTLWMLCLTQIGRSQITLFLVQPLLSVAAR